MVHRTLSRLLFPPIVDALFVVPAEAFQSPHSDTDFEVLKADSALCVIYTIFLGGCVWEELTIPPLCRGPCWTRSMG